MNSTLQKYLDQCTEEIMGIKTVNHQRFADLIVQECAHVARMCSVQKKPIHPDILWEDMSETAKMVNHTTCQTVAEEITAAFDPAR
jgi:hypothetical protein